VPRYNYEVVPHDNAGSACIGGCGGGAFVFHDSSSQLNSVKQISVWTGGEKNGFRAIRITLEGG
jgi:hypothetical protein